MSLHFWWSFMGGLTVLLIIITQKMVLIGKESVSVLKWFLKSLDTLYVENWPQYFHEKENALTPLKI